MIYPGKWVSWWVLTAGGKGGDLLVTQSSCASSLLYALGHLPLSLSFFICEMVLSLSPWALQLPSVAILSFLTHHPVSYLYQHCAHSKWPEDPEPLVDGVVGWGLF